MATLTAPMSRFQDVQITISRRCANSSLRSTVCRPCMYSTSSLQFAAEGAHHADSGERLAHPAIDLFGILAHRTVDRPDALARK